MQSVSSNAVYNAVNGLIKSVLSDFYEQITIPSTCYLLLQSNVPSGKTIIGFTVERWSTNTGAFSIVPYTLGGGTQLYIIGNAGTTITNLQVRLFYI